MAPTDLAQSSRYLTFRVGQRRYALLATAVSEVIRIESVARVPQGPRALLGLTNLRGLVVPVVGLRELLGQDAGSDGLAMLGLVLNHVVPTALVVDAVESLEEVSTERIDRADEAWDPADGEKICGAFKRGQAQELTKILDIEALLAAAFAERSAAKPRERSGWGSVRRTVAEEASRAIERLLTFTLAAQEFAFPLTDVEELLPLPASVSTVSRTDTIILGFTSIRDSLIPLLSLRGLLGFEAASRSGREKVLISTVAGMPVGLVVDDARAVVSAETSAMEPVPAVLTARTGGESRIRAVYRGDGGRRLISILSPELLFRDEVMQRLAKVRPVHTPKNPGSAALRHEAIFLVFRLGDAEFGLPIDAVVEVASLPAQITRVPKAPKFLEGVVNLRGDVLPVVDQRRRFDMPALDAPTRRLGCVVVKTQQLRAGLIVDSVTDVLRTLADAISPPPELTSQISRLVHGVVNREASQRLVLLLDPTELLTRAELGQLDTFQTRSRKARA